MKRTVTEEFAQFVQEWTFDRIPDHVVEQAKDFILDCVGTTVGSYAVPEGRLLSRLGKEFGAGDECTILPSGQKAGAAAATYVNAKLSNFIDNEETLYNYHHIGGATLYPALHAAERMGASGRDLILATVLGYEFAYRFCQNYNRMRLNEDGSLDFAKTSGLGFNTITAALATAKVLGLDVDKVRTSMGIAGYYMTIPIIYKFHFTTPFNMMKYQDAGWIAFAGLMAALFAKNGYTADQEILDDYGDNSLWKVFGMLQFDFDSMVDGLGKSWGIMQMGIKPYPCCRWFHTPIFMLQKLMAENQLAPDEIDTVTVGVHPLVAHSEAFQRVEDWPHVTEKNAVAAQFSLPYCLACGAYNVPAGPHWQLPHTMNDPRLGEFCSKVRIEVDKECEDRMSAYIKSGKALGRVMTQIHYTLTVTSRGEQFTDTADYVYGDTYDPDHCLTREHLKQKFATNCSMVLTQRAIDRVIDTIYNIETLDSVDQFTALFR
jgi:2-methylcitrate dehydratase PrpD